MQTNEQLQQDLSSVLLDLIDKTNLKKGDFFILGGSSSEVIGESIGQATNEEIGDLIVSTCLTILNPLGIHLAVQGCEHINRALTIERAASQQQPFDLVSVVPRPHAGGALATAAYQLMNDPVEIEHLIAKAGLDIGDTHIGMHVKHVQIPIRPLLKELGCAHLSALGTRPKLIGGERAQYAPSSIKKK